MAVDERLAAYGFETNTGARFVVVVDVRGRGVGDVGAGKGGMGGMGLREGEMKAVSLFACLFLSLRFLVLVWDGSGDEKVADECFGIGFQGYAS